MSKLTPEEMITTMKCLNGLICKAFKEGYLYQRLKGFYPIHIKKVPSWLAHMCSKDEKVVKAHIYSPAFQMAWELQEYSQEAHDHPEKELQAWHAVLISAAEKKYIPHPPDAQVMPAPTASVPGAVPGSIPVPTPIALPIPGPPSPPIDLTSPTTAPANKSAPICNTGDKSKMAMITPVGHPSHGPLAPKARQKGDKGKVADEKGNIPVQKAKVPAEKVKAAPAEHAKALATEKPKTVAGKKKPKPDEDGWYVNGIHDFPCDYCDARGKECERCVGKDHKVGACVACFLAKNACAHAMKGKGKKPDGGVSDGPKKVKTKHKPPQTPEYISDGDESHSPPPRPPPAKPAWVIVPADPIRVMSKEDMAAARRRAQGPGAQPHVQQSPHPLPRASKPPGPRS
ncbi:hypothetical protein DXG01_004467 [Tephrocybe rancida]|nr:hypothetical protein DXG01_004467 [Tephrocybe rancida]